MSDWVSDVVVKALEVDGADRYQNASEMQEALLKGPSKPDREPDTMPEPVRVPTWPASPPPSASHPHPGHSHRRGADDRARYVHTGDAGLNPLLFLWWFFFRSLKDEVFLEFLT